MGYNTQNLTCGRPRLVAYSPLKALLRAISTPRSQQAVQARPSTENERGMVSRHGAVTWKKEGAGSEMNVIFRPMA